jgi:hypothetical protein
VAQNNLGWMYLNGKGVAQDDAEAAQWYRKAAEQGFADAQNMLGWMYQNGQGVECAPGAGQIQAAVLTVCRA